MLQTIVQVLLHSRSGADELIEKLRLSGNELVLDIGCGDEGDFSNSRARYQKD